MYKCEICGKEFKTKRGLKVHKSRVHAQAEPPTQPQPEIEELKAEIEALKSQLAQSQTQDQLQQVLGQIAKSVTELKEAIRSNPQGLVEDAVGFVMAIANIPETAKSAGFSSGINTAVIKNQIERALNGQISFNELMTLIDNAWHWVKGYVVGDEAFQKAVKGVEEGKQKAVERVAERVEE